MALRQPESMDELVYFTKRAIGKGYAKTWVFREQCPKCAKSLMGKPRGSDGSVKIRATEYVCPSCGHTEEKKTYEESLQANIAYTCPSCAHTGEAQIPYKRKKVKGVDALVFTCSKCNEKILITKKLKEPKA